MTPWTVAHQAPLSMGFSRQEYWSELPFPALEDPSHPVIRPRSPAWQVGSLLSEPPVKPIVYLNIANLSSFWKWKSLSHVWLFATPWTVACQASLTMGIFQARIPEWGAIPSPNKRIKFCIIWATRVPKIRMQCIWVLFSQAESVLDGRRKIHLICSSMFC